MKSNNERLFENKIVKGLLTCIIVTYNSGDYLYEAIDSVLNQSYPSIELIISDDGSVNYNENVIMDYIEKRRSENIKNIILLHREKNIGTVRNINNALAKASGEFIKLLGGDDNYPNSDVFFDQVQCLKKDNIVAVVGKAQQCDSTMKPIYDERVERSNSDIPIVLNMSYIDARRYIIKRDIFPIAIQTICYKRDFFIKYGFCDEDYVLIDDAPSALLILKESKNVEFMDKYTVNHRAKVGISSSRELFSVRRLLYYNDCLTYAKKEVYSNPDTYSFLYRIENLRVNEFVYSVVKMKSKRKGMYVFPLLCIKYIDAIIYYIITNPKKFTRRIIDRLGLK